jgi:hypothetical protein
MLQLVRKSQAIGSVTKTADGSNAKNTFGTARELETLTGIAGIRFSIINGDVPAGYGRSVDRGGAFA